MIRLRIFASGLDAAICSRILRAGAVLLALKAVAFGGTFTFDTDPLAGTIVRSAPGRQLVGGEQFIPFNTATDVFAFGPIIFGGQNQINLANGPVGAIPATDVNVAVLQTLDDDNNPLTPFGAFNAADLLASRITQHGPGVFIYFNEDLALPVLVYSDDLASNQADLRALARMLNLNGQTGIDALPRLSAANFAMAASPSAVPEPSNLSMWMVGIALVGIGGLRRLPRARRGLTMPIEAVKAINSKIRSIVNPLERLP